MVVSHYVPRDLISFPVQRKCWDRKRMFTTDTTYRSILDVRRGLHDVPRMGWRSPNNETTFVLIETSLSNQTVHPSAFVASYSHSILRVIPLDRHKRDTLRHNQERRFMRKLRAPPEQTHLSPVGSLLHLNKTKPEILTELQHVAVHLFFVTPSSMVLVNYIDPNCIDPNMKSNMDNKVGTKTCHIVVLTLVLYFTIIIEARNYIRTRDAIKIQRQGRSYIWWKTHQKNEKAAILLRYHSAVKMQSKWRQVRCRNQYQAFLATLRMQSIQWMYCYIALISSIQIQTFLMSWYCFQHYQKACAATQIQSHWRSHIGWKTYQKKMTATIKLQSKWRQVICRNQYQPCLNAFRMQSIQWMYCYIALLSLIRIETFLLSWYCCLQRTHVAVQYCSMTKVQSKWRQIRCKYQYQTCLAAIIILQSACRRYLSRRKFQVLVEQKYAIRLQRFIRLVMKQMSYKRKSMMLNETCCQLSRTEEDSAIFIQSKYRCHQHRKAYVLLSSCVHKIQAVWRSGIARNHIRQLRYSNHNPVLIRLDHTNNAHFGTMVAFPSSDRIDDISEKDRQLYMDSTNTSYNVGEWSTHHPLLNNVSNNTIHKDNTLSGIQETPRTESPLAAPTIAGNIGVGEAAHSHTPFSSFLFGGGCSTVSVRDNCFPRTSSPTSLLRSDFSPSNSSSRSGSSEIFHDSSPKKQCGEDPVIPYSKGAGIGSASSSNHDGATSGTTVARKIYFSASPVSGPFSTETRATNKKLEACVFSNHMHYKAKRLHVEAQVTTAPPRTRHTHAEKLEILQYEDDHGNFEVLKCYKVRSDQLKKWRAIKQSLESEMKMGNGDRYNIPKSLSLPIVANRNTAGALTNSRLTKEQFEPSSIESNCPMSASLKTFVQSNKSGDMQGKHWDRTSADGKFLRELVITQQNL
jgi:IQ calmodulin-binding motif